eukprot:407932-Alexandrium_andersonii.AAC.1
MPGTPFLPAAIGSPSFLSAARGRGCWNSRAGLMVSLAATALAWAQKVVASPLPPPRALAPCRGRPRRSTDPVSRTVCVLLRRSVAPADWRRSPSRAPTGPAWART